MVVGKKILFSRRFANKTIYDFIGSTSLDSFQVFVFYDSDLINGYEYKAKVTNG